MSNNTLIIYIQSSCASSRKAIKWLEENKIPYKAIHLRKQGISTEHLKLALIHSEDGFESIIKKGKEFDDMEDMSVNELLDFLSINTEILKAPMIIQGESKVFIGYNDEEISTFLPKERKKIHHYQAI